MAVVLGLAAALIYGAADFTGGLAARRTPALAVVVLSQIAGLGILLLAMPFVTQSGPTARELAFGAAAGLAGGGGVALLYRGLAVGRMSVVAPVTAVGASLLPVLVGLLSGERPGVLALAGVAVALVAVVLVSASPDPARGHTVEEARRGWRADGLTREARQHRPSPMSGLLPSGLAEAIAAGVAFGLFFVLLDAAGDQGGLWPLVGARTSILVAGLAAVATRTSLRVPGALLPRIALAGVLDMAANLLYVLAARQGLLSLVAVLTCLYPASTILLARVVLGERLGHVQMAGIACAGAGVALITLG